MVGRMGPGMRKSGDQSMGRGNLGGEYGAPHCNQWGLWGIHCAKVREPSELWFGVVRGVNRGIAVLDGVHFVQGEGEVFVPRFLL